MITGRAVNRGRAAPGPTHREVPADMLGLRHSDDTTEEYRQLARALDWRQILRALTVAPAERFGYAAHKGRLAPGMDADLVVLDGDPSKDVTAFARVRLTVRAGQAIYDAKVQPVG